MSADCLCCTNKYDMGCFVACSEITLPITATMDGVHTIIIDFVGRQVQIQRDLLTGAEIKILPHEYNEDYQHTVKVLGPNGDVMTYEPVVGTVYDCFVFTSHPRVSNQTITQPGIPITLPE